MATVFDVESTLTGRYQTTVPETVRCALDLGKRDKIHYIPQDPGRPEYRQGSALGNAYKHWGFGPSSSSSTGCFSFSGFTHRAR